MSFFVGLFSAFVGAFLAAFAKQFVDHVKTRSDSKRKTRDTWEDLLLEALSDIREISSIYWSQKDCANCQVMEAKLTGLLSLVPEIYSDLFSSTINVKRQCDVKLNELRKSVSGGDFGVRGRSQDLPRIADIELRCRHLEVYIRVQKAKLPFRFFEKQ